MQTPTTTSEVAVAAVAAAEAFRSLLEYLEATTEEDELVTLEWCDLTVGKYTIDPSTVGKEGELCACVHVYVRACVLCGRACIGCGS